LNAGQHILVIKLSALGDFVQAMGPFAAIRAHHPNARITLLTSRPFADFAAGCPYFDQIWIDPRPRIWDVPGLFKLRKMLRQGNFDRVYDLQTSDRSTGYFQIMGRPPWSGIAPGCAYPHANPDRDLMHTLDRQAEQLAMAGIPVTPAADLSWVKADLTRFALPKAFVLMVPGGAAHRHDKRWPAESFAQLARHLSESGITTLLLGTELDPLALIARACPNARSLAGQTSFAEIVALARLAMGAIGNDTGPMHLVAAAGCPALVLFSAASDPALCAPRGRVQVIRQDPLEALSVAAVIAALGKGPAALRQFD